MRTIQDLAKEAIQVQDACNLSGVVHGFSRAMTELREILRAENGGVINTHTMNHHPICCLWASKIHDLTSMGLSDGERFREVYEACEDIAKGVNV
jgi:hypothetical protein